MKSLITVFACATILFSCGGGSSSQENTKSDEEIANEIIQTIDTQKEELSTSTEETLNEVDSLLENL